MTTKPLTHAEIIRKLLVRPTPKPSVTLKLNAKGETQIEVTATAASLHTAGRQAQEEYDRLTELYVAAIPLPDYAAQDVPFQ